MVIRGQTLLNWLRFGWAYPTSDEELFEAGARTVAMLDCSKRCDLCRSLSKQVQGWSAEGIHPGWSHFTNTSRMYIGIITKHKLITKSYLHKKVWSHKISHYIFEALGLVPRRWIPSTAWGRDEGVQSLGLVDPNRPNVDGPDSWWSRSDRIRIVQESSATARMTKISIGTDEPEMAGNLSCFWNVSEFFRQQLAYGQEGWRNRR